MRQKKLLIQMEQDFSITRPIFLNLDTGWFDHSRNRSNLVRAKDITAEPIQGRYRLNLEDNNKSVQEFFFDLEWSSFSPGNKPLGLISKTIVNDYYPRLKQASKKLLDLILRYIPKDYIYIKASGSGLHIQFFLEGLENKDQWQQITDYFIAKSNLPNTKHADKLVFGLDKDTIISTDRKISEFGSWNKLKKELKKEVDYLHFTTFLTVDEFLATELYPFCHALECVRYPDGYKAFFVPKRLLADIRQMPGFSQNKGYSQLNQAEDSPIIPLKGKMSKKDIASNVKICPAYWSILRKTETEWYERHFLVKYLKYALRMSISEILDLFERYACWSDYKTNITRYYVRKHFKNGTCETKVRKPVKKETLVRYGLCKDDCDGCVYG